MSNEFDKFWGAGIIGGETTLKEIAEKAFYAGMNFKKESEAAIINTMELEGGYWYTNGDGNVSHEFLSSSLRRSGSTRKTKEAAAAAAKQMRRRNVLAAWVYECPADPGHDGSFDGEHDRFLYVDSGEINIGIAVLPDLANVYMSDEASQWLCDKLNSGEIVLP